MSIIIDFIIVFFFIVGVISTVWIVWEYVDEWLLGKDLTGFSIPWRDLPVNYKWNEVKFRNERDFLRQIQRIKG